MPEDSKAVSRDALLRQGLARTREGLRLAMIAQVLESQGHPDMAEATREVARLNDIERSKLREKLDALDVSALARYAPFRSSRL